MNSEYFIVLALCAAGPAVLSFSKKLNFYRIPMRLVLSVLYPMIIFLVWDIFALQRGHWYFNGEYITGLYIFTLPVEEILFFIVIPFCALFTWEVVKYYSRKDR